jgi:hypothetical protein
MSVGIVGSAAPPPKPKPEPKPPALTPTGLPTAVNANLKLDTVCLASARQTDLSSALLTANASPTPTPPTVQPTTPATVTPASASTSSPLLKDSRYKIFDPAPGWPTILSTVHAGYTAPREAILALRETAAKNQKVAGAITRLTNDWSSMSPAARDASAAT